MTERIVIPRAVAASRHEHGMVLLHIAQGRVYATNRVGAEIWQGLQDGRSLDAIVRELSDRYSVDRQTAREHATRFLSSLEEGRLVERRSA